MERETLVKGLKALGDPTRLHIVEFLGSCCCSRAEIDDEGNVYSPTAGEVCCHLTGSEKVSSTVSHHLHELEGAGLIRLRRVGKTVQCSLDSESLARLGESLIRLSQGSENGCC